jgi:hypothetical protein
VKSDSDGALDSSHPRLPPSYEPSAEDLPPLDDPYYAAPLPKERAQISLLALASLIALLLGPIGAVAAVVFGLAARREIAREPGVRTGRAFANAGVALGTVCLLGWSGALGYVLYKLRYRPEIQVAEAAGDSSPAEPARNSPAPAASEPPAPTAGRAPRMPPSSVPKNTRLSRVGNMSVVDVGTSAPSLSEELAKQRAEAAKTAETVVLMTTGDPCEPCRGVDTSLRDPLLQTALSKIRLVRVDVRIFREDLDALKVPNQAIPGFFLLSLDLTPRDGIDGGEWDDDIPVNIAPVLGAFVRGKYERRRKAWQPLPGSGMTL